MTLLLIHYFLFVTTALVLGLVVYKVFDKIIDFIKDLVCLISD